ncbi:hypothetical protein BdPhPhi1402_gp30 [Bdellovibrio phage phi1402]|uniref:hypothetical protein n=1 Tax=Bdellovibrio phage phi1402 TaxID=1035662 RepID=UPI000211A2DC|nr:hypothetical protein BdPhPhi1402_gp30 [Bdellovibrio phage phi1402]AEG42327.1 hypothetical protein [Bdellovibrio phage phi1402]
MGYSQDEGYVPETIEQIMNWLREKVNELFSTNYTEANFVGTNWYKFSYAWAQRMQRNEVKTSEIFLKLQNYISVVSEKISRPVTTAPGIVEKMKDEGYIASVKPMTEADRGLVNIAVDVDDTKPDYPATKIAICNLISRITVGGTVTQGTEVESVVISNGQAFDYKFHLPNRIPTLLKLTVTESENNQHVVMNDEEVRDLLLQKISSIYSLGKNFEPQTYFTVDDAPWAGQVLLEYSLNAGVDWESEIYDSAFDALLTFDLDDVQVILN